MEVSIDVRDETTEAEFCEPLFIYEEGDEVQRHGANSRKSGRRVHAPHVHIESEECEVGNKEAETEDSVEIRRMGQEEIEGEKGQVNKKEPAQQCEEEVNLEGEREDEVNDERKTTKSKETKLGGSLGGPSNDETETEAKCRDMQAGAESEKEQKTRGTFAEKDGKRSDMLGTDVGTQVVDQQAPKQRSKDTLSPQDAQKQMRRLTPDFPDSLYELLCSIQEGRRLNDQRCSFTPERRCHSEPSTPVPRHKVMFSSMTSLQKEEFFELVATFQGRRLDDQRAELQRSPSSPEPPQFKVNKKKNSIKEVELKGVATKSAPKEDLYNMILTSQAQGRLEDQRSAAPGPMDDEDFFSLLLKVQGGRMDEQRTELPMALQY
ncbi:G-protein-signaling modulator 1-like [Scleropages formosus]|uniref:G-protein-signaling modulator 1-like n=1 Tax=Scleropages formosus TaxID=113540 RepID=A0A8C9WBR6_SCLFO|nr:G-protein-signaling modulator 1-like [Scleropages formosus]XP_029101831.1 G-protein-signaling modulator 1-like [Scleropages formosus]